MGKSLCQTSKLPSLPPPSVTTHFGQCRVEDSASTPRWRRDHIFQFHQIIVLGWRLTSLAGSRGVLLDEYCRIHVKTFLLWHRPAVEDGIVRLPTLPTLRYILAKFRNMALFQAHKTQVVLSDQNRFVIRLQLDQLIARGRRVHPPADVAALRRLFLLRRLLQGFAVASLSCSCCCCCCCFCCCCCWGIVTVELTFNCGWPPSINCFCCKIRTCLLTVSLNLA